MIDPDHSALFDRFSAVVANMSLVSAEERLRLVYDDFVLPDDVRAVCEDAERLFSARFATDLRAGRCSLVAALATPLTLKELGFAGNVEPVGLASLEPVSGVWLIYRLNCGVLALAASTALADPKNQLTSVRLVFTLPKKKPLG